MAHQFVIFVALVAVARASVLPGEPALYQSSPIISAPIARTVVAEPYDPNPQYSYGYDVQDPLTGDSHGQVETRNGDVVSGSYNLLEADGTRRVVDYTADPINGFNAVVSRQGGVVATAPALARVSPLAVSSPIPTVSPVAVPAPFASPASYVGAPIASVPSPILRGVGPLVPNAPWAGSPVLRSALPVAPWAGSPVLRSALPVAPWAGSPVLRSALPVAPWQGAPVLRSAPVW